MSQQHTVKLLTPASHPCSPSIQFEFSLSSDVAKISPFMDTFMLLIRKCRCIPGYETDLEISLREALENAVVHGNHEDPRKRVYVSCRYELDEVSIAVRDEGQGFDLDKIADPTAPDNIQLSRGRGIYLIKALMDEVRFEEGGVLVYMRKRASSSVDLHPEVR
ncbi:MAG: ATP-binding protein [Acidobacteriaceae bacterium]